MRGVFVVLCTTDCGTDVSGVFDTMELAFDYVKRRRNAELDNYKEYDGLTEEDFHILNETTLYVNEDDFWKWTIFSMPLRESLDYMKGE